MSDRFAEWLANRKDYSPAPMLPDGTTVGDFRIVGFLGRGGSGEVYRAEHRTLKFPAAVKVLHRGDETGKSRFAREAEILANHPCPGFPRFFAYGEVDGLPYLATELLDERPLPTKDGDVSKFICQIAAAVGELHKLGYVHRDIKPSNILWRTGNNKPQPVLIDFGLAKPVANAPAPSVNTLSIEGGNPVGVGTPGYAAPEQFAGGDIDFSADIHALGVLIYECFNGHPPKAWTRLVEKATSSIPVQRFVSIKTFLSGIKCVAEAKPPLVKLLIIVSLIPVAAMVSISLYYFLMGVSRHGCNVEIVVRWIWSLVKGVVWLILVPLGLFSRMPWARILTIGLGACICLYICASPWMENGFHTLFHDMGGFLMALWAISMVFVAGMLMIPSVVKWYKREI